MDTGNVLTINNYKYVIKLITNKYKEQVPKVLMKNRQLRVLNLACLFYGSRQQDQLSECEAWLCYRVKAHYTTSENKG